MATRAYLTGAVGIEAHGVFVGEREFPGRQGRLLFAFLVAERHRSVLPDELAEELWGEAVPSSWDRTITSLVSKLRAAFGAFDVTDVHIEKSFGCYAFQGPTDLWVDVEAGQRALEQAEAAIQAGRPLDAGTWSQVAFHVLRRPFLVGDDGPWASAKREELRLGLLRALACLTTFWYENGEEFRAIWGAEQGIKIDCFHEPSYQALMRAHAKSGNRAEVIRAYDRCRKVFERELGTDPSPTTSQVFQQLIEPNRSR